MLHRHNWKLEKEYLFESEAEQVIRLGLKPNTYNSLKRTLILVYKCSECNKLKSIKKKV